MTKYIEDRTELHEALYQDWAKIAPLQGTHTWFGVTVQKHPFDIWVYQEMLYRMRPDVIIEIGHCVGGSTMFFAHMLDLLNHGRIVTIDITDGLRDTRPELSKHARIEWITADATDPRVAEHVKSKIKPDERVWIIEDSAHDFWTTYNVLEAYHDLIKPGDYFVVEDTICQHGLAEGPAIGAWEAVDAFLEQHPDWQVDRSMEKFSMTWCPRGFLQRKK
jgi:cephalosporin hydroxylase